MNPDTMTIGFAITGSFCTYEKIKKEIITLVGKGYHLIPIFSYHGSTFDNRFCNAPDYVKEIESITGSKAITTIQEAEPIGPKALLDALIIAPCTGNTLAKMANGITDTPVLMAAKAHLRNERPVIIAISTNDALGANFKNMCTLLNTKYFYFVPFGQDNFLKKPNSLVAHMDQIELTLEEAMKGHQIQPLLQ